MFNVEIVPGVEDDRPYTFEVVINLLALAGSEPDLKDNVNVIYKIATSVLNDSDSSSLHVISINKYQFDGLRPSKVTDPVDNSLSGKRQKRERARRYTRDVTPQFYYEYKWTNKTLINKMSCPMDKITSNIVDRIFRREYGSFEKLQEIFASVAGFELLNVHFRPVGNCKMYMEEVEIGHRPIPFTTISSIRPTTSYGTPKITEDLDNAIDIDESTEMEYYLTTVFPVIGLLIVMLLIGCIIALVLYRTNRRRKSVEISTRIPGDGNGPEREAFLQKGRIPIILEFEQQQQHLAHQQQPYNLITPVVMPQSQQHSTPQQVSTDL